MNPPTNQLDAEWLKIFQQEINGYLEQIATAYDDKNYQLAETTTLEDWQRLLTSPLGAALKKALGEPLEDISL